MNKILDDISKMGIVPVLVLDNVKNAKPVAEALCNGGLPCAEITFRTEAAEESIKIMTEEFPEMLVGAGTVLTVEQVKRAVNAGAKFIVSPGFNPKVVSYCVDNQITVVPGCTSPSDIEAAIELGITTIKFFPAEAAGGIKMIKAMSAPYSNIRFMPTGGINASNLKEYLDFSKVIACGGSWMVSKELLSAGDFEQVTVLTKEAVNKMLGFEFAHVGINEEEKGALITASVLEDLFGFTREVGGSSIFAGKAVEVMKSSYLGKNGHIGIATNYIGRAVYHLQKRGVAFDMDTAKYDSAGNLVAVYLEGEIAGFAIHIVQKK